MTDEVPPTATTAIADSGDTVRKFLFALAEEDFDTFESLAAPGLIWQNVGLPSIRGRRRVLKLLRRAQGKFGFAVKFHRVVADERSREQHVADERSREEHVADERSREEHVADERSREELAGRGGTVLTERTDAIILGPVRLQFWVCGVFEINDDGQITLWRDYFDIVDVMVKAPLRALAGTVVPALNPKF